MEDWQETAFNNRRIPHGKGSRGAGIGKRFDARKTYGVYELGGATVGRNVPDGSRAIVEIHGPTDSGDGLVGSVEIGKVFRGMIIMAGSRRTLERNVSEVERAEGGENDGEETDGIENDDDDDDDDQDDIGSQDERAESSDTFEKNSFRSPKFWVQWRAQIKVRDEETGKMNMTGETDRGYFVFAGNDCKAFQGTLNCKPLGWKNAAITGRKLTPKATDCPTNWTDIAIDK